MIEIQKDTVNKATMLVRVYYRRPISAWCTTLSHVFYDEPTALLFIENAQETMGDRLAAIREEAYKQGYTHGKAKMKRNTWFSRCW